MRQDDYDARRIETRANHLIAAVGLQDAYGEKGGLLAEYDTTTHQITISDEAVKGRWDADDRHRITPEQWEAMQCFIKSCTEEGCPELHEHCE